MLLMSPSAMKVWIEMMKSNKNIEVNIKSPSARKVWIEIKMYFIKKKYV